MWKRRSRMLVLANLCTSLFILLQMGIYVTQGLLGRASAYNLFDQCSNLLGTLGLSWMVYVMDAAVVYTLITFLWVIGKQFYYSRRTYGKLLLHKHYDLTEQMNHTYSEGGSHILVVSHPESLALTMGFIRPQIIVSTGMLQLLDEDELEALIQHETFHRNKKDPLKTFLMSICSSVLWYIPILTWSYKQYVTVREVLADAYAMNMTGSPESLGSALLKLLRANPSKPYPFTYASFAESSINYRIQHIIDPETKLAFQWPVKSLLVSLQIIGVISVLFLAELL
ncbi:heat shock protein HtpX [compost metagenome]